MLPDAAALADGIRDGNRTLLSRAITLVESRRAEHRAVAREVLGRLLSETGRSQRIGITGVPGVGKSTFIDAFGTMLTDAGHRLAVLAVDPSSQRTGGSILGDKTRMARLAGEPSAFIRPSPTSGELGGVAAMTRETMLLCEAAGFDVILVETVGVGQSETTVADMVDFFMVLMLPGAGDELQGIKKGVIELADMIVINKSEGDNRLRAQQAAQHYRQALHILEPRLADWSPPVHLASALASEGLSEVWSAIQRFAELTSQSGAREDQRRSQQTRWFRSMVQARWLESLSADPARAERLERAERAVANGSMLATTAVHFVLEPNG